MSQPPDVAVPAAVDDILGIVGWHVFERALHTDKRRTISVTLHIEPIGVGEPGTIVVRRRDDRLEERFAVSHGPPDTGTDVRIDVAIQ